MCTLRMCAVKYSANRVTVSSPALARIAGKSVKKSYGLDRRGLRMSLDPGDSGDKDGYVIAGQDRVSRHEGHIFNPRLGDEKPVEGVFVDEWEIP